MIESRLVFTRGWGKGKIMWEQWLSGVSCVLGENKNILKLIVGMGTQLQIY